jgi:hypothetical protein
MVTAPLVAEVAVNSRGTGEEVNRSLGKSEAKLTGALVDAASELV